PTGRAIFGTSLRLSWLHRNFAHLPLQLFYDPNVLERHAWAYILYLLGRILFPDSSGDTVSLMFLPILTDLYDVDTYSWGSGTKAWLYRSLCKACHRGVSQIDGNLLLLQLWAWEQFPIKPPLPFDDFHFQYPLFDDNINPPLGACWVPKRAVPDLKNLGTLAQCQEKFDELTEEQVIWTLYLDVRLDLAWYQYRRDSYIWRCIVPLISSHVEWHYPNRVVRQFGLVQHIPLPCDTDLTLHAYDLRGFPNTVWTDIHRQYITQWNERHSHVIMAHRPAANYMEWYRSITCLWIA
ncbi:LOW QUALITY PROTEIN: PMD domain-containing protein, partial [Cephalotus follicularis]